MTNQLVERGYLTQSLGNATHSGGHGFKAVPGLLKLAIEKEAWKERIIIETGEEFPGFTTIEEYVITNPPRGLGATKELIEQLIRKNAKLLKDFQNECRKSHPQGGDRKSEEAKGKIKVDNINFDWGKSDGTSRTYALQKLSDDEEHELLEQVESGKISAHAAMIKAGKRKPKISIRLDSPESAAKTLLAHASPTFLQELRRLLSE